jgi:multidrug efflux pump subunit AcrB
MLSTLCICIVFVPVFLLQGTAKYLFSPLSVSVIVSLLASLVLSFTMVPVLFNALMRKAGDGAGAHAPGSHLPDTPIADEGLRAALAHNPSAGHSPNAEDAPNPNVFLRIHLAFERGFQRFRESYRNALAWALSEAKIVALAFGALIVVSLFLFPQLGRDFFPQVDAGEMRLHVRAPPGTRIEATQADFARVESTIRQLVGNNQISVILDNIGLPYSGINISLSDSATVGPMDGEILISLTGKHSPTADLTAMLRRELPKHFPELQFFFQPADIVDQVLNFGQPAPIDIRVSASDTQSAYALAQHLSRLIARVPGIVDSHVFQVPDAPALSVDVDRAFATQVGVTQREAANNVLVATNSSAQTSPNFWVDPRNSVSYPLVVQQPTYSFDSSQDIETMPVTASSQAAKGQLLMNLSSFGRERVPLVSSQLNIRPVFDVHADVQGRDLYSASLDIDRVLKANQPPAEKAMHVTLSGQVETMRESYSGLFSGIALAVVLVYLFLVINFQSWIDPLIVLLAVPFALCGVMWMLFLTQTHLSVPALMGTLMCIGLTTANSILVVSFANQRMDAGDSPLVAAATAGSTRIRPVLMTAGAMILGMIPMALGVGEGGEQNAPLARAVIGGLLFATFATLVFVPVMYRVLRRRPAADEANANATA